MHRRKASPDSACATAGGGQDLCVATRVQTAHRRARRQRRAHGADASRPPRARALLPGRVSRVGATAARCRGCEPGLVVKVGRVAAGGAWRDWSHRRAQRPQLPILYYSLNTMWYFGYCRVLRPPRARPLETGVFLPHRARCQGCHGCPCAWTACPPGMALGKDAAPLRQVGS